MKWNEVLKCTFSASHAYTRGILAARKQLYEECADYLSRIEKTAEALQNATNFAGALARGSLVKTSWWKENREQLDSNVVKRIEGINTDAVAPETSEGQKKKTNSIPEDKVRAYIQGAFHALRGEHDQAATSFEDAWYQKDGIVFTLPLEGTHLAKCLSGSTISIETWIDAAGGVTGRLPQLTEMSALRLELQEDKPRTATDGSICHVCRGIYKIIDFSENRGCPHCGGKYLTTTYNYSHNIHNINFNGQKFVVGLHIDKLPQHNDFKEEFGFMAGNRGIGCIAAVIHFSKFVTAVAKSGKQDVSNQ